MTLPAYHILATSSVVDERTRVLKHGDAFALFDHYGDIKPGGLGEQGLYCDGTRFLSVWLLELEGARPFFLSSTARRENVQLATALTNPDVFDGEQLRLPLGTLHLAVRKFLWRDVLYQRLTIVHHGADRVDVRLALHFDADFADIYEVRGLKRQARGEALPPCFAHDSVTLAYRGLDGSNRRSVVHVAPAPASVLPTSARFELRLSPREEVTLSMTVACEREGVTPTALAFDAALAEALAEDERGRARTARVRTSNALVDQWIDRAACDLQMMTTELPTGPYPYAGVPWFNTPFGRDGIITALESLWLRPSLARGVLSYLASTQATSIVAEEDAEPGKILHETRNGEMARLKEMPFGRYYGTVDATPLFVMLAGAYYERTGDRAFVRELWPHVELALFWIDRFGDRDGDGFVEYQRRAESGLLHQGWKDSDDAIAHANGEPALGPVALCEVQAYVYGARGAAAALARALGKDDLAIDLLRRAEILRDRFDESFWCDDLGSYALALDGEKRPCRVRTSNAGHCLFTGIARPARAARIAETLLAPESFSGWGIRTLASSETRYNPLGYHTGAIWPHDNALVVHGLARYGHVEGALSVVTGMFDASLHFDLQRMPELFCGVPRTPGDGPVLYPVACAPQAWAAASVFLLLQAFLGLDADGAQGTVTLTRPRLPASVDELCIYDLEVAGGSVDLSLVRRAHDVAVNVLRREGDIRVVVVK